MAILCVLAASSLRAANTCPAWPGFSVVSSAFLLPRRILTSGVSGRTARVRKPSRGLQKSHRFPRIPCAWASSARASNTHTGIAPRQSRRSFAVAVSSRSDRKEKKKKVSLNQIPINPAVPIVILLPTSQVHRLGLPKAPARFFRDPRGASALLQNLPGVKLRLRTNQAVPV